MKYGKTERICGIVILLALAAIIVPWLMSDPAPRDEPSQPSFDIDPPVDAPRQDVAAPQKPASIVESQTPEANTAEPGTTEPGTTEPTAGEMPDKTVDADLPAVAEPPAANADDQQDAETPPEAGSPERGSGDQNDPIADLVQQGSDAPQAVESGEWAVQVGSFGQADNASRLQKELEDKGFRVYTRARDNDLTTVLAGPYGSAEDGERARALIKQKANQQGLLIRVRD